ncbi:lysine 2,3-aminomutase [Pseudonocardia sp. H11422]|uniref:KamA family radical SAM protein n=1 Tax=Pseudonocardia sp. H11422 TaxID=2835866 RepID=UPI0027E382A3|nr:lysine 2,3-aminomutase [Pseudonocardia sp. H11422]
MNIQPYRYQHRDLVEPDWTRLPGWRDVTCAEWESAQWQRAHCVKNIAQLRMVFGDLLPDSFYIDLDRDRSERATMAMLLPPQMLNTMVPDRVPDAAALYADPVRRYMLPVFSDRDQNWTSHPYSTRDSLHEQEMWAAEGLTHRYPTKVLAELLSTCPQYCGHCTRMDLVGTSTPQVHKLTFLGRPDSRQDAMIEYLRRSPHVRDVVVSGGDVANVPWKSLEQFVHRLLEVESIRDIRLASKALVGLPQHWLQGTVRSGMDRLASLARSRGAHLAIHTHANCAQSVTPLVADAAKAMLDSGVRDVRNQGVLLRGVNDSHDRLLDLCFALLDGASIMPYYFYMCDMIPNAEHWRIAVWEAQELQHQIMGYLPGFATPRVVCDVPYLGKRWVHQIAGYDRQLGISYWAKNYLTPIELEDPAAASRHYEYYDPIPTLPQGGQEWWRRHAPSSGEPLLAPRHDGDFLGPISPANPSPSALPTVGPGPGPQPS